MPWADPKLMQEPVLGPALQQAGFGSSNPGHNPYWFNDPSKLQSGQGDWSSAPGLLSKGYPNSWYDFNTEPGRQPVEDPGAAASAAAGPKFGGYGGNNSNPSAYAGGINGLMNQMMLTEYNKNSGLRGLGGTPSGKGQSGGYIPGGGNAINATNNAFTQDWYNKNLGAGWGTDMAGQMDTYGSYQVPAGAVKGGAPAGAFQENVANEYARRLNEQASGGSAPNIHSALTGAGQYYGLNFQPLGGNTGRGYSAQLPAGTPWW